MEQGVPGGPIEEIYHDRTILDEQELRNFCTESGLTYEMCDIHNLSSFAGKYCFVHTGQKDTAVNDGNENHWMALYGNLLFDSYGLTSWQIPQGIHLVRTIPKRLQSWSSNVCGSYCCAFLWFCENNPDKLGNIGRAFTQYFNLGKQTEQNDREILTWFENVTPTLP